MYILMVFGRGVLGGHEDGAPVMGLVALQEEKS